jgi:hypothetical protein
MALKGGPVILGVGGVAAAAAAAYFGLAPANKKPAGQAAAPEIATAAPARAEDPNARICLRADIGVAEAKSGGCYTRREFAAMASSQVRDAEGAPVKVSLSHPTDYERDASIALTCAEYRGLTEAGWYALSTSEMKREAFFHRACGVLSMLERARTPDVSYFNDGRMQDADAASLSKNSPFGFGGDENAPAVAANVARGENGVWKLDGADQKAVMQEIAHADFNADGLGDMLVFVSLSVEGGTATAAEVGLVVKRAADGPCAYEGALGG